MSVREEEQRKSSPSRSIGLAAAIGVVGVGVGAALYYLFNKRSEHEAEEASPSQQQQWNIERTFSEQEQMTRLRQQAFQDRSWSLEECSICFEIMLKDQELVSLPCAHNFHLACIGPWLEQQSTCPNCRNRAE